MNDLYVHQLETENKQLREALRNTRFVLEDYKKKIDRIEKYIVDHSTYKYSKKEYGLNYIKAKELLEIVDDKI